MKKIKVQKSGWNGFAMLCGPFWYIYRGMVAKGFLMLIICLITIGVGIIPTWIYCGFCANKDFYNHLKRIGVNIQRNI